MRTVTLGGPVTAEEVVGGGRAGWRVEFPAPAEERVSLQLNRLRSHAAGLGPTMSVAETRAMWCGLAASLAHGHSGVRPAVVRLLAECLDRGVTPVVPEWGFLGPSGDLTPLLAAVEAAAGRLA